MNSMLEIALMEFGTKEWAGTSHNPEVLKYFSECCFEVTDDETSWCGASMCWCAMKAGLPFPKNGIVAREWLNWGVQVVQPKLGDIVVFWRESITSWKGHVGLYIRNINSLIYTLSGNQGNTFNITPYSSAMLLGFRRFE